MFKNKKFKMTQKDNDKNNSNKIWEAKKQMDECN